MITTFLDREIERLNTIGELNIQGKAKLTEFKEIKEQLILSDVMPSFLITYKEDEINKELYWKVSAKNEVEAIDHFWKKHDVLCDIINVKPN